MLSCISFVFQVASSTSSMTTTSSTDATSAPEEKESTATISAVHCLQFLPKAKLEEVKEMLAFYQKQQNIDNYKDLVKTFPVELIERWNGPKESLAKHNEKRMLAVTSACFPLPSLEDQMTAIDKFKRLPRKGRSECLEFIQACLAKAET